LIGVRGLLTSLALVFACALVRPGRAHADDSVPKASAAEEGAYALENALLSELLRMGEISAAELAARVAEVGGVPFLRPVGVDYLTHQELGAYLRQVVDTEYPPEKAEPDERLLTAFDLIDPGLDLRAERLRLMEQNIAGFYDERPQHRRLFVVSAEPRLSPLNQLVLAHEMRHALQDQYATVHEMLPADVGDFEDRRMAIVSLLEGDATLVMEGFLRARASEAAGRTFGDAGADLAVPTGAMPGVPEVLRDQMLLPYTIGLPFVRALKKDGGWEAVQKAWCDPPVSTEQVLHPEKYRTREAPRTVAFAYAPPGGKVLAEGAWGEALIRTLIGAPAGPAAAAGWGGDLFRVFDVQGKTLLVWRTAWDSGADAREFAAALLARYARSHRRAGTSSGWNVFKKGEWTLATGRVGDDVWLVSSDGRKLLERAVRSAR
jgi:hypothetical protein